MNLLSWLPRGPFLDLACGALLLVLIDALLGRKRTIPWSIPTLVVLLVTFVHAVGGAKQSGDEWITLDRFSTFVTALVCMSAALAAVLSETYLRRINRMRGDFFALLLFSSAGMVLFASSTNLLILFLGLELLSIPIYILSGYCRSDAKSGEAALKYFLLGAFSSAIFLLGIAFVYGACGSTDLILATRAVPEGAPLARIGYLLILIGFLFKVASVPFHMWTPDVYEGAPTTVTAFMATGVKAAAFAALLRVLALQTGVFSGLPLTKLFWWLAVLTMTVGNLAALTQSNIKRMLAYSSIAHAGYILVGVTVFSMAPRNPEAASAILYYLLAYTFMTAGAFAVVVALGEKGNEHLDMGDYGGLGWRFPALGIAMSIFMIALSGIPPTAGFFGKYAIFRSAVIQGQISLVVIAVLNSALSVYYYLRVMVTLYMRPSTEKVEPGRSLAAALVVAVCVLAILWAGFGPDAGLPGVTQLIGYARASVLAVQ
jgi:NADH-quinone oxidoreductase subunit N